MRVFVAGGTGVIGRRLVPRLVARGHQVTATKHNADAILRHALSAAPERIGERAGVSVHPQRFRRHFSHT